VTCELARSAISAEQRAWAQIALRHVLGTALTAKGSEATASP
jgi:hypothetical protein